MNEWETVVRSTEGTGKWPVHLDRPQQGVVRLGIPYHENGATLKSIQDALLRAATNDKTRARVGGVTTAGDTSKGLGWVDQWFNKSWIPPGCRVDKSRGYSYQMGNSRIRLVAESIEAKAKLRKARETVENHNLVLD